MVVCIVADGRKNVDPRVLDCLAALGVFQEGAMTNLVKERPVTAHVFEYTTSFALDGDMHFKYPDKGIVPCQIIFCMKEKNVSAGNGTSDGVGQKDQLSSMVFQRICTAAAGQCRRSEKKLMCSPTYASFWMSALVPHRNPSIISGRPLT